MARRTFAVIDVVEILAHWYAGRSKKQVAASLGVDRSTVAKYVAPAVAAGMSPGGPAINEEQWRAMVREWFPKSGRHPAQPAHMARDRPAPRAHRGPGGRGAGLGYPPAPSRLGGAGSQRGQPAPLFASAFC